MTDKRRQTVLIGALLALLAIAGTLAQLGTALIGNDSPAAALIAPDTVIAASGTR